MFKQIILKYKYFDIASLLLIFLTPSLLCYVLFVKLTQEFTYARYTSRPDENQSPQYKMNSTKTKTLVKQMASSNMTRH